MKNNITNLETKNDFFDKKGITQDYFYKRFNLSEKKNKKKNIKIHELNFNPTFFDKDIKANFVSHLNINSDRNHRPNSLNSSECHNNIKSD